MRNSTTENYHACIISVIHMIIKEVYWRVGIMYAVIWGKKRYSITMKAVIQKDIHIYTQWYQSPHRVVFGLFGCWGPEVRSRLVLLYLFVPFEIYTVFKHYLFKSKLKCIPQKWLILGLKILLCTNTSLIKGDSNVMY